MRQCSRQFSKVNRNRRRFQNFKEFNFNRLPKSSQNNPKTVNVYVPQSESEKDIPWSELSSEQKTLFVKAALTIKKLKFALYALASLFFIVQPLYTSFNEDRNQARQAELTKAQKDSENSLALSKMTLSNLLELSSQIVSIKAENETLKARVNELEKENKELRLKLGGK